MIVQLNEYRRMRRLGLAARHAFFYAHPKPMHAWSRLAENREVTWHSDGFDWKAWSETDHAPELKLTIGEFSNHWSPGAIRHRSRSSHRREYEWFIPAITEDEHYAGLRQMQLGRTQARELARQYVFDSYRRARDYGSDWCSLVVWVSASLEGVLLADDCISGIESDADPAYFEDVIKDVSSTVLNNAQQQLKRLCAHCHHT